MVFFSCHLYVLTKNIVEYKCADNLLQNSIAFNIGEKYQKAGYRDAFKIAPRTNRHLNFAVNEPLRTLDASTFEETKGPVEYFS